MPANTKDLQGKLDACHQTLHDIKSSHLAESAQMFEDAEGCTACRGRGWVVTWDTLDSMSGGYHESGTCTNCDGNGRLTEGERILHPSNNKYDNFHSNSRWSPNYSVDTLFEMREIERNIVDTQNQITAENQKWTVMKDRLVEVVKQGRGPKNRRTALGVVGIVLKTFHNSWGTPKTIILDEHGVKHWPNVNQLAVIEPEPKDEKWNEVLLALRVNEGLPLIATVKAKSAKASLVVTTTRKEQWIPFSMSPELQTLSKGETGSFNVPLWFIEKNDLM